MKNTKITRKRNEEDPYSTTEYEQLHAGSLKGVGQAVWHTETFNDDVVYWCALWHHRTAEELMAETLTVLDDLVKNHPELNAQFKEYLIKRLSL